MKDNTEVVTTDDKNQRDRMFDDLRQNGNQLEKQAVKFSGNRTTGKCDSKGRMTYVSTWSVAYPKS